MINNKCHMTVLLNSFDLTDYTLEVSLSTKSVDLDSESAISHSLVPNQSVLFAPGRNAILILFRT